MRLIVALLAIMIIITTRAPRGHEERRREHARPLVDFMFDHLNYHIKK